MIDLLCIVLLYLCCLLSSIGSVQIPFLVIGLPCIARVVRLFISFICNRPIQDIEMPERLQNFTRFLLLTVPSFMCIVFTVFSLKWYVIFAFLIWVAIEILCFWLIKPSPIKRFVMILLSCGYGLVLAEWYLRNPLENKFGNNNIFEVICIMLSALVALIPLAILEMNRNTNNS